MQKPEIRAEFPVNQFVVILSRVIFEKRMQVEPSTLRKITGGSTLLRLPQGYYRGQPRPDRLDTAVGIHDEAFGLFIFCGRQC